MKMAAFWERNSVNKKRSVSCDTGRFKMYLCKYIYSVSTDWFADSSKEADN